MSSIRSVLIFLTFSLVLFIPAFSQQQDPALAREFMTQAELTLEATRALDDARDILITAANFDTTFLKANFEAGSIHLQTIHKEQAVKYLMRVYRQDPTYRFDLEYQIGRSYQFGLDFDKAIQFYNLYKQKLAKKPNYQGKDRVAPTVVDRNIFECENGKAFVANPGNYSIVNIGREINSEFEDYAPVLNEREDEIVFTTRRKDDNINQDVFEDNKPFEDIFTSHKTGGKWAFATNLGPKINKPSHDSNLALSADGNTLFIYSDDNGGDIYFCDRTADGTFGEPQALPGIINSSFEEKSITISKDEKTLYFTSNRPGGFGGTDIYRATKDLKGEWSNVKNVGPKINTETNEDGPFLDYDGVTLYFSSRGHKGMGGHDIFKAIYNPQKNEWSEPENLGYPINTPDDDIYIIFSSDGKRAYYSSTRDDGMGYTDIYLITVPESVKKPDPVVTKDPEPVKETPKDTTATVIVKNDPVIERPKVDPPKKDPVKTEPKKEPVKTEPKKEPKVEPKKETVPLKYLLSVVDAETNTPLNVKVKLQGLKDNVIVASTNNGAGNYEFKIVNKTAKDYKLSIESDGYVFVNQTVKIQGATDQEKTVTRTIQMRKLSVGVTSILRNLYFDFDKATFETESYGELNKLEAMLRQNENLKVEIGGHTDAVGTKNYNIFLSRKRAEAVKDYLTKKGIDPRRIKAVGYGKTKPLASNDDEAEGREINRRVEFKVLQN
jgi:outer membrane protein OmpA-like peptidoglycan-associated protein